MIEAEPRLVPCAVCDGTGRLCVDYGRTWYGVLITSGERCPVCGGTGERIKTQRSTRFIRSSPFNQNHPLPTLSQGKELSFPERRER